MIRTRWLVPRDIPALVEMDERNCPVDEDVDPAEEYAALLSSRNCVGMVAEVGKVLVGFVIYELRKHELLVRCLGVDSRGLGDVRSIEVLGVLVDKLISRLSQARRRRVTIYSAETHLDMQLALKGLGFWAICVKPGFYGDQDAYVFQYSIRPAVAESAREVC